MNWRAGLFRIWILVSAVWIAAWAIWAIRFSEWKNWPATYEITDPSGLKFTVHAPRGTSESDVVDFVRSSNEAKKRQEDCAKKRAPSCDYAVPLGMPGEYTWLIPVIAFAVGGPLIVFCFGLACFWVASGFRQSPRG
jgi:hypothetical protein